MSDRPVHTGTQVLVGPVGCRRQGGLRWAEVLEAWAGDRFPKNNMKQTLLTTKERPLMQQKSTLSSSCMTQLSHHGAAKSQRTRFQYNLACKLIIHVMRPHFGGFSWRYLVEEKWEQLGGESASSTLGWRERDRSVLSEDESAVISLSPCFSLWVSPCYTSSPRFLSPICLSISLYFDFFTITSSSSFPMKEPTHCTHHNIISLHINL